MRSGEWMIRDRRRKVSQFEARHTKRASVLWVIGSSLGCCLLAIGVAP